MAYDILKLIKLYIGAGVPLLFEILGDKVRAIIHSYTYKAVSDPKNVVIIGGSFAGVEIARKLMHSLPTGYRVVLIEKNSHFNYTFNFPRYSVLEGHEKLAFIPYEGIAASAPNGSFRHVRGTALAVNENEVRVESRDGEDEVVTYAYLVIATGSAQSAPAKLKGVDKDDACKELRSHQTKIKDAGRIAIVGGGAVGVELVADIKSFYPDKQVTLVHSRSRLLPRFGKRLHDHVVAELQRSGIDVVLNARPRVKEKSLEFDDGRVAEYDLVVPCTGQTPNTSIIEVTAPNAISPSTGRILVQSTLQVSTGEKEVRIFENVFAIGDVAETGGPKMARAAFYQVFVVKKNILDLIRGRRAGAVYQPKPAIEGALKLTIGKINVVLYTQSDDGDEILMTSRRGNDDLDVQKAWKMYGADSGTVALGA